MLCLGSWLLTAQTTPARRTLSGYISDADSGERLIGATVLDRISGQGAFTNITEEYFRYSVTALRKAETEDIPFIEPVTVFGNLENGIGIFGMYHEQQLPVK